MISKKDIKESNLTEDDIIKIIMAVTGAGKTTAAFIHAIEVGKLEGDVIELDGKGKPVNADKEVLESI